MLEFEELLADAIDDLADNFGGVEVSLNTGEVLTLPVVDRPEIPDPLKPVQAQSPIYTTIYARASDVAAPRNVSRFTETVSGKWHTVLKLVPSSNPAVLQWECEKTR